VVEGTEKLKLSNGDVEVFTPVEISRLLAAVTEALPDIAEYPFTTKTPIPGMMKLEDIQIQLVDTPPVGYKEVRVLLSNALRSADIIAIVIDLSLEPLSQVEAALHRLTIEENCTGATEPISTSLFGSDKA
jgi:ribosome-interacting GTPase 1